MLRCVNSDIYKAAFAMNESCIDIAIRNILNTSTNDASA